MKALAAFSRPLPPTPLSLCILRQVGCLTVISVVSSASFLISILQIGQKVALWCFKRTILKVSISMCKSIIVCFLKIKTYSFHCLQVLESPKKEEEREELEEMEGALRTLHVQMDSCGAFREEAALVLHSPTYLRRPPLVGNDLDMLKSSMVKELEAKLRSIQDNDKKKHRRSRSIGYYIPFAKRKGFGQRDRANRLHGECHDEKSPQKERYYVHSHFLSVSNGGTVLSYC